MALTDGGSAPVPSGYYDEYGNWIAGSSAPLQVAGDIPVDQAPAPMEYAPPPQEVSYDPYAGQAVATVEPSSGTETWGTADYTGTGYNGAIPVENSGYGYEEPAAYDYAPQPVEAAPPPEYSLDPTYGTENSSVAPSNTQFDAYQPAPAPTSLAAAPPADTRDPAAVDYWANHAAPAAPLGTFRYDPNANSTDPRFAKPDSNRYDNPEVINPTSEMYQPQDGTLRRASPIFDQSLTVGPMRDVPPVLEGGTDYATYQADRVASEMAGLSPERRANLEAAQRVDGKQIHFSPGDALGMLGGTVGGIFEGAVSREQRDTQNQKQAADDVARLNAGLPLRTLPVDQSWMQDIGEKNADINTFFRQSPGDALNNALGDPNVDIPYADDVAPAGSNTQPMYPGGAGATGYAPAPVETAPSGERRRVINDAGDVEVTQSSGFTYIERADGTTADAPGGVQGGSSGLTIPPIPNAVLRAKQRWDTAMTDEQLDAAGIPFPTAPASNPIPPQPRLGSSAPGGTQVLPTNAYPPGHGSPLTQMLNGLVNMPDDTQMWPASAPQTMGVDNTPPPTETAPPSREGIIDLPLGSTLDTNRMGEIGQGIGDWFGNLTSGQSDNTPTETAPPSELSITGGSAIGTTTATGEVAREPVATGTKAVSTRVSGSGLSIEADPATSDASWVKKMSGGNITADFDTAVNQSVLDHYGGTPYTYQSGHGSDAQHHAAVDVGAPAGTPIASPIGGKVLCSGGGNCGPGAFADGVQNYYTADNDANGTAGTIVVQTDNPDIQMIYGHAATSNVQVGQAIKSGDVVGSVGDAGTGAHTHVTALLYDPALGARGDPNAYIYVDPTLVFNGYFDDHDINDYKAELASAQEGDAPTESAPPSTATAPASTPPILTEAEMLAKFNPPATTSAPASGGTYDSQYTGESSGSSGSSSGNGYTGGYGVSDNSGSSGSSGSKYSSSGGSSSGFNESDWSSSQDFGTPSGKLTTVKSYEDGSNVSRDEQGNMWAKDAETGKYRKMSRKGKTSSTTAKKGTKPGTMSKDNPIFSRYMETASRNRGN